MSDSAINYRQKINTAKDLQSVVRSMKALAASNIEQFQQSVLALSDYYHTVELGLSLCLQTSPSPTLMIENQKHAGTTIAIVFGSDQGLVGQFNDTVVDHAIEILTDKTAKLKTWAVGERAYERLVDARVPLMGLFSVPDSVKTITPLIEQILIEIETKYDWNQVTKLQLFYNAKVSDRTVYRPIHQQLLPLNTSWQQKQIDFHWPTNKLPEIIGDETTTLQALIREYIFISLYRACAESLASENTSRLTAMQRADKNIEELLKELNGTYHRLRQNRIDEELFDVISAFESLS